MTSLSPRSMTEVLQASGTRPSLDDPSTDKKNYSERLSRNAAIWIANLLRPTFPSITPYEDGRRQEQPAASAHGVKKLDVNFSTPTRGLELGVSVKSINFMDKSTRRFTKNYSRNDNELRAEASDYHRRQPYAVLTGVFFLPIESCDDSRTAKTPSSFAAAVQYFKRRTGRTGPADAEDRFEGFFIGLYDPVTGDARFFPAGTEVPHSGRPELHLGLDAAQLAEALVELHQVRNRKA